MTDVVVVIPAFDEEACIGEVVTAVRRDGYDCVVVDDASTDRTAAIAEGAGATVIRLPINLGVGGAFYARHRDRRPRSSALLAASIEARAPKPGLFD